jgi:hypothetical protein
MARIDVGAEVGHRLDAVIGRGRRYVYEIGGATHHGHVGSTRRAEVLNLE